MKGLANGLVGVVAVYFALWLLCEVGGGMLEVISMETLQPLTSYKISKPLLMNFCES
jgi:hypothetical protein